MEKDLENKAREIMGDMTCPKDFTCCKQGFENLCKAEDIGLQWYLLCLEPQPQECKFSVFAGGKHLCECPLRVYIAKKVTK
jgi:hypothetical protein